MDVRVYESLLTKIIKQSKGSGHVSERGRRAMLGRDVDKCFWASSSVLVLGSHCTLPGALFIDICFTVYSFIFQEVPYICHEENVKDQVKIISFSGDSWASGLYNSGV